MTTSISDLVEREEVRREKRNLRDRLAREYIRTFPGIKEKPEDWIVDPDSIPDGTSEAAIRSIAKQYSRQKVVRSILRERTTN